MFASSLHVSPLTSFSIQLKNGQENTLIQTNTWLNEYFALNSQIILIQVLDSRHTVEIRTAMRSVRMICV